MPAAVDGFSGLCFMGGPMSVNDPLPWIEPVCALIREAAARNVPVIGHCLGGQLMSKALGGMITRNPVKELGWGEVDDGAELGLGDPADVDFMQSAVGLVWRATVLWMLLLLLLGLASLAG